MGVIFALFVGLGVLGAFIEPPKSKAEQSLADSTGKTQPKRIPPAKKKQVPPAKKKQRSEVARLVVTNVGFSKDATSDAGSIIEYGVVISNRSPGLEARNVTVTVRGVDVHRRSSVTDQKLFITAVPAGGSFVVAGLIVPTVSLALRKLTATVRVGTTTRHSLRLPVVTNVRLDTPGGDLVDVTGRLTNRSTKPLSPEASMYAIFLDRSGRIVGSSMGNPGAVVRPGATVSFNLDGIVDPAAHPVSARVSVDPCSEFGSCVLP